MRSILLGVLVLIMASHSASADYILTIQRIGPESVSAQSNVTFDVILELATGSASFDLNAVQSAFNIRPIGAPVSSEVPSGLGLVSITNYLADFSPPVGATNPDFQQAIDIRNAGFEPNFDFNVNSEKTTPGDLTLVIGTEYHLFQVTLNTGTLATGTYELSFQNDQGFIDPADSSFTSLSLAPFSGIGDPGVLGNLSILDAQFTVSAVPEPSSGLLLLSIAPIAAYLRRKTKKKNSSSSI